MAFRDIQRIVSEWYQINVQPSFEATRSSSYFREIVIGVCGALIIVGGVWGYKYHTNNREAGAQIAFAENIQIYHEALQGKSDLWSHVEMKCTTDYERYKSSSLAPYFLMVKADALVHQSKIVEAGEILDTVIASLPKDSPVLALYKTKRALIKIDMPEKEKQAEGLEELRQLGADKTNLNNDVAQYYLGLYYWSHDDLTKALEIWKELVVSQAAEKLAASPWASLAQEKLAQRCMLPEKAPIEAPKAEA
jgi:predicted negative regulator of RcsB-dependent stress response